MPQPSKIPLAFAASGDKNIIPESTETTGLASWRDGFPAITSTPFSEGGIAPKRADFNGIFNALSTAILWGQQGGVYAYDNATDYEPGNVVSNSGVLYVCRVANGPSSSIKPVTDATAWQQVLVRSDISYDNFNDVSVPNDVVTNIATIDIPPGRFLVIAYAAFAANNSGYRQIGFGLNATQSNSSRFHFSRVAACPSATTVMILPTVFNNTGSGTNTYYLNVRQNSGASLNVTGIGIIKMEI